mmetsp:Transcript_72125/g.220832  ORF Transcript_72125/g.220832 Transcript_72125/m.220832 type:complete len:321 (+) Transcript_72125:1907-2869(+)
MRPNEHESTVFMKVVLDMPWSAAAAFSMFALSKMLVTMASAMPRISGVPATSWPMCRSRTSASFLTSFLASPTASRTAIMTFGICSPSCLGVSFSIRWMTSFSSPMQPTFTFHFPAAAAPRCANSVGKTSSGTAAPRGPHFVSSWHKSSALPSGSVFNFASSSSKRTADMHGSTAGGFHKRARIVRNAWSRVAARLSFCWMFSIPAETMDGTSARISLLYAPAPAPAFSCACASSLPSTALRTTATTSTSHSKGPPSAAAGSFGCSFDPARFGAACSGAFFFPLSWRPPASASSSSRSFSPRFRSRSSSSSRRTYVNAAR